jgi:hypothetical protein
LIYFNKVVRAAGPRAEHRDTASAVQFLQLPLTAGQAASFTGRGAQILLGFDHPIYGHIAVMPDPVRAALVEDL